MQTGGCRAGWLLARPLIAAATLLFEELKHTPEQSDRLWRLDI